MKQKEIFLHSEGDAWFSRNTSSLNHRKLPDEDPLLLMLIGLPIWKAAEKDKIKILEIGSGDGARLAWLKNNLNVECYGIEPSQLGVNAANEKGVHAIQGTADILPFDNKQFDLVIFGFCLYLCDRDDLFRIASEANRVLRNPGWLALLDFYSPVMQSRHYHHKEGVSSYKMDYRKLFTWHPSYECLNHKVFHHENLSYTDDPNEWISVSMLRKFA
jgi:ubiquinone/menaquinone biosynthesis C-methylase UbiE